MSDPTPEKKKKVRIASASGVKKAKYYLLEVLPGQWFKMQRLDLMSLFFEGALPTPILAAVDDLQEMRKIWIGDSIIAALDSVTDEQRIRIKELMRRVAARAAREPRLTLSKREADQDPNVLWLGGYSDVENDPQANLDQDGDIGVSGLMIVWRSVMGEADVVTLPYDEAETFRQSESESPDSPVLDGENVRTEAVVVGTDAGDHAAPRAPAISLHHE